MGPIGFIPRSGFCCFVAPPMTAFQRIPPGYLSLGLSKSSTKAWHAQSCWLDESRALSNISSFASQPPFTPATRWLSQKPIYRHSDRRNSHARNKQIDSISQEKWLCTFERRNKAIQATTVGCKWPEVNLSTNYDIFCIFSCFHHPMCIISDYAEMNYKD